MSDDANLQWFDKLQARDFANGAVIDAIRRVFKEHAGLRTQLAIAQAEVERVNMFRESERTKLVRCRDTVSELVAERDKLQSEVERSQREILNNFVPIDDFELPVNEMLKLAKEYRNDQEAEIDKLQSDLTKRDEVLRVAHAALEFYSDWSNYEVPLGDGSYDILKDAGSKARAALTSIQSCLNTTSDGEK